MKKLKEMKKNNKGFSLVELIVVIAIMVVLVAVLGSTILGYVEKSKYSKDVQALDSLKTAVSTYVSPAASSTYDASKEIDVTDTGAGTLLQPDKKNAKRVSVSDRDLLMCVNIGAIIYYIKKDLSGVYKDCP